MTSELKIKANRANSRASTGPRTRVGRARAARNALRHGLSLPVCSDPVFSGQVEELAREIAGGDPNPEIRQSARLIAEAQIDLLRVRQARHQLLTDPLDVLRSTPRGDDKVVTILSQEAERLDAFDRYERRARSRRNLAVQEFDCAVACKYIKRAGHNF